MNASRRIAIEEFDYYNKNICSLRVAMIGHPQFGQLKKVTEFTDDEKVAYMRVSRYVQYWNQAKKASEMGLIPALDPWDVEFEIPEYISRAYLETLAV